MSAAESKPRNGPPARDILTLAEAAEYLRVPPEVLAGFASDGKIPGRKIGDDWRFLRTSLNDWLRNGGIPTYLPFPPGSFPNSPFIVVEELLVLLERRMEQLLQSRFAREATSKPGSKQAVLSHVGLLKDHEDLEKQLADLRAQREAR